MSTSKSGLAGSRTKDTNVVVVVFSQNLPARVDDQGQLIAGSEFHNRTEFSTSTLTELTGQKVGLWMLAVLKSYMKMQKLQSKPAFKMNKHINVDLTINNKQEMFGVKFSFNEKRMERLIERHPAIVSEAFNPAPAIGNITEKVVRDYVLRTPNLVIAPAKTAKKQKQLQAANIEQAQTVVTGDELPTVSDATA